jgi:hypothetical protein
MKIETRKPNQTQHTNSNQTQHTNSNQTSIHKQQPIKNSNQTQHTNSNQTQHTNSNQTQHTNSNQTSTHNIQQSITNSNVNYTQWPKLLKNTYNQIRPLVDNYPPYSIITNKLCSYDALINTEFEKYLPILYYRGKINNIDFSTLPNKFVIKPLNQSCSEGIMFINDKSKTSLQTIQSYYKSQKWFFPNRDQIMIQEYLFDINNKPMNREYKFHMYNGSVLYIDVIDNILNKSLHKRITYTRDWNRICMYHSNFKSTAPLHYNIKMPEFMNDMIDIVEKMHTYIISLTGLKWLRIDMFFTDCGIKFGEFCYTTNGGYGYIDPYNKQITNFVLNDKLFLEQNIK